MRAARWSPGWLSSLGGVCGLVAYLVDVILNFVGSRLLAAVLDGIYHVIDFFACLLDRAFLRAGADAQCERAQGKRQYFCTSHLVPLKFIRGLGPHHVPCPPAPH